MVIGISFGIITIYLEKNTTVISIGIPIANSWDELQLKSLDNTYQTLYNYNSKQPVQGTYITSTFIRFPN